MKTVRGLTVVLTSLVILLLGAAALLGFWSYDKMKQPSMPELSYESLESYSTNIANSLLNNRELEIPPEILSKIVRDSTGEDVVCAITGSNMLKLWFSKELPYLGKAHIGVLMDLSSYSSESGELSLTIKEISIGQLIVPSFLKERALGLVNQFYGDSIKAENVSLLGDKLKISLGKLSVNVFGTKVSAGIDSITIKSKKMLISLYANADFKFFG